MKFIIPILILFLSFFSLHAQGVSWNTRGLGPVDTVDGQGCVELARNVYPLFQGMTEWERIQLFRKYLVERLKTGETLDAGFLERGSKPFGFTCDHYVLNSLSDTSQMKAFSEKIGNSLAVVQCVASTGRKIKVRCSYILSMQTVVRKMYLEKCMYFISSIRGICSGSGE